MNTGCHRSDVFTFHPGRQHNSFPDVPTNIFEKLKVAGLHKYHNEKKRLYTGGKKVFLDV